MRNATTRVSPRAIASVAGATPAKAGKATGSSPQTWPRAPGAGEKTPAIRVRKFIRYRGDEKIRQPIDSGVTKRHITLHDASGAPATADGPRADTGRARRPARSEPRDAHPLGDGPAPPDPGAGGPAA